MLNRLRALYEVGHGDHRQIRSMEGLRGLAVFLVFLVHYVTLLEPWLNPDTLTWAVAVQLRGIGHAGVDLFFVLSGYLIYGTLIAKPRPLRPYLRRRVQRIYPAFLAVFLLYLLLSWVFPQESKIPSGGSAVAYLLANLLLLPGLLPIEPIITVAWSLSYEMFYYLAVPLVIAVLGLRAWSRGARVALFAVFAGVALGLAHYVGGSHVRLVMFVSGILLFEALGAPGAPRIDRLGLLALLAGVVAIDLWATGPARFAVLFATFFMLCYSAFRGDGLTARLFCWTPLRWLGNMSYSYYLIHGLALKAVFFLLARLLPPKSLGDALAFWGLMPMLFALTLLPATLLFALVERPYSLAKAPEAGGVAEARRRQKA